MQKDSLIRQMLLDTGDKPNGCRIDRKSFTVKAVSQCLFTLARNSKPVELVENHLNSQKRILNGDTLYSYKNCGLSYKIKATTIQHMLIFT